MRDGCVRSVALGGASVRRTRFPEKEAPLPLPNATAPFRMEAWMLGCVEAPTVLHPFLHAFTRAFRQTIARNHRGVLIESDPSQILIRAQVGTPHFPYGDGDPKSPRPWYATSWNHLDRSRSVETRSRISTIGVDAWKHTRLPSSPPLSLTYAHTHTLTHHPGTTKVARR